MNSSTIPTHNNLHCELTVCFIFMKDEILEVAGKIYKAGMSLLVIDTENKFVSTGFAKEIARVAQGLCNETLFQTKYLFALEICCHCQMDILKANFRFTLLLYIRIEKNAL